MRSLSRQAVTSSRRLLVLASVAAVCALGLIQPAAFAAGTPTCRTLVQLLRRIPQQIPRDDQPLDFAGAFVDVEYAGVAEPLLCQMLG